MPTPSLDNPIHVEVGKPEAEDVPRRKLCEVLDLYGRAVCDEPQRCEALLRDFCVGYRREIFLLVAALKERIVPDILTSLGVLPDDVVVSNLTRKLSDNLGLTPDSARWAVESWMLAVRTAPAVGRVKKQSPPPAQWVSKSGEVSSEATSAQAKELKAPQQFRVDWAWFGLCFIAITSSSLALAVVARVSFYHNWVSFGGWFVETMALAAGLAISWAGEFLAARQLSRRRAPQHSALDPRKAPAAMLLEVIVLLIQPVVPIGVLGLWLGEWFGGLHVIGQNHDLAFNLGRLIQSILIGLFVFQWGREMTTIQGKIASSMVRRR